MTETTSFGEMTPIQRTDIIDALHVIAAEQTESEKTAVILTAANQLAVLAATWDDSAPADISGEDFQKEANVDPEPESPQISSSQAEVDFENPACDRELDS